jgi:hypothetical protein
MRTLVVTTLSSVQPKVVHKFIKRIPEKSDLPGIRYTDPGHSDHEVFTPYGILCLEPNAPDPVLDNFV